jgi:4'-phosphopantetheinyl transferase
MQTATTQRCEKLSAEAHVWLLRTDGMSLQRCMGWLGKDERAHWEGLDTSKRKHEFLAMRAFCRGTLSRYAAVEPGAWKFGIGNFGKPEIEGPREFAALRFNLSHTSGLVACIVSRAGDVGVDTEETARAVDVEQVVRHFFSQEERDYLAGLPTGRREEWFFERWVLKEAYVKGRGVGLGDGEELLAISQGDEDEAPEAQGWRFAVHRPTARHVAAAAVRAPAAIRWFTASGLSEAGVAIE